jgi:YidC/Oxa1 family membrane protein insertase
LFNLFLTQYNGIFIGPIAKLLGVILNALYNFLAMFDITNAALSIILFTFIVKALMIPLTIKQQKFSKVSSAMNPEIMKIQAKYKGKKDEASMRKQQLETQAVYQKYGSNPTSGCLPMLITIPIIFALYRVVYNIPAYVNDVHALYETIAKGIQGTSGYTSIMTEYADNLHVKVPESLQINNIIDILAKFKTNQWNDLASNFPALSDVINTNADQINHINSFVLGLNIADAPGLAWPGILIPVLAAAFQFIQTRLMPNPTTGGSDENNSAMATMKTMNNVMPIMSGIMCLAMPVGIGIYWIAGSVFQILQQLAVNRYLNKVDVNDLIQANVEKASKRNAKLGIDPNKQLEELAKKQTKSINGYAKTKDYNTNKNSDNEPSSYAKSDVSYKPGSIAEKANLLKNRNNSDKGDK